MIRLNNNIWLGIDALAAGLEGNRSDAEEILNLLGELQRSLQKTILMVTHDPRAAERARRVLHLEKGRLVEQAARELDRA